MGQRRMKPQCIFTIDTKALRRAGFSEAEIDGVWDSSFDALVKQLENAELDSKGAKARNTEPDNLRDRLRQRWE